MPLANALFALALLATLTACASDPMPRAAPAPALPGSFSAGSEAARAWGIAAPADAQSRGAWWRIFGDPVLDALVERAERGNSSLGSASAQLARSRAVLGSVDAARAPQAGAEASAGRQEGALVNPAGTNGTLYTAGVHLSYEFDLAGRLARASQGARLDAEAHEALLQGARLMVQAEVAQTYLALRLLDAERAHVAVEAAADRKTLHLLEQRVHNGSLADADLVVPREDAAASDTVQRALERRRAELLHALALLVGEPATGFDLPSAAVAVALPAIPAGIPGEVLARRPDVAAAQRSLMAAQSRGESARLAWFPRVVLTVSGGQASPDLASLLQSSMRTWGLGALLALPLFDGGRREAGVRVADAELQAAVAAHRAQVLLALREVEDQLSGLQSLHQEALERARGVALSQRNTAWTASRQRNGLASQLDVLLAQRNESRMQRRAVRVQAAQVQATVGLIRALGGGWDAAPGTAAAYVAGR